MYKLKNNTFAEAGYILNGPKAVGMWLATSLAPFTEREIDLTNLTVTDSLISFDIFKWKSPGIRTYADAKKYIIGKRYSNDDQLAIMLNKDNSEEDAIAYQKMQEWREWASLVSHKIVDALEAAALENEQPINDDGDETD